MIEGRSPQESGRTKGEPSERIAPRIEVTRGTPAHVYTSGGVSSINRDESLAERASVHTDSDLVLRAQNGEVSAYGELVNRHQRSVYGIVSRMVSNRDDIDDIVQDVFVLAYKSLAGFRRDASFSTWLHSIAVNTALKQMKKMKIRQGYSIDDPDTGLAEKLPSDSSPADEAERTERSRQVRKAIETLPDKHRAVIVLHYFQEHSCEEIAKILDCSVGTVWSRLHYACKKLKGQLEWIGG